MIEDERYFLPPFSDQIARTVEDINHAVTQPARLRALSSMRSLLNRSRPAQQTHLRPTKSTVSYDSSTVDCWVRAGAANSLCLKLGYVLQQHQHQLHALNTNQTTMGGAAKEINEICSMLCILYSSCSEPALATSIKHIGVELLPLLFRISRITSGIGDTQCFCCNRYILGQTPFEQTDYEVQENTFHHVLSAIFGVSRVENPAVKRLLLEEASRHDVRVPSSATPRSTSSSFLDFLCDVLSSRNRRFCSISTFAAGIVKNLLFRAPVDVKLQIAGHAGLIDALSDTIQTVIATGTADALIVKDAKERSRQFRKVLRTNAEYASAAIWNLVHRSADDANDASAYREMTKVHTGLASNENLVATLSELLTLQNCEDNENDSEEDEVQQIRIRRNAVSSLGNLASMEENKLRLVSKENVLESLLNASCHDLDADVRRRATRTIRYLALGDSNCATLVAKHRGMIDTLARQALTDSDADTRNQAIGALSLLSSTADSRELTVECCRSIVASTVNVISSLLSGRDSKHVDLLMLALLNLSKGPDNLLWMVNCNGLFDTLHAVVSGESLSVAASEHAAKLVYNLSGEKANLKKMGTKNVFHLLADLASFNGVKCSVARSYGVQTIVRLAEEESNVQVMAGNEKILTALVNFALESPDGSLKTSVKESLLKLVPDM